MTEELKRKYRIEEDTRHAYNLLVIYPNGTPDGHYDSPVGTLRFEANSEGDKEKELWIKLINSLNLQDDSLSG